MIKKLTAVFFVLLLQAISMHATAQGIEMADAMRSNGKIYVVVAVISIVLSVLLVYLTIIDRKLSKLEKKLKEKNKAL